MPRLRNPRPVCNEAYQPTTVEHCANVLTHGFAILPSLIGLHILVARASTPQQSICAWVYGLATVALFVTSTTYHVIFLVGRYRRLQYYLHVGDRATIYIFIAASYTPWLQLKPVGWLGEQLKVWIWLLALFGIAYQWMFHERYKLIEVCLYVVIGALPGLCCLITLQDQTGVPQMLTGGLIFFLGVAFFKCDGILPCAHALWHCHVICGVWWQYSATRDYLIGNVEHSFS